MVIDLIRRIKKKYLNKYRNVVQIDSCENAVIITDVEGLDIPIAVPNKENEERCRRNKIIMEISTRRNWINATIRSMYYSHKGILNYISKIGTSAEELKT